MTNGAVLSDAATTARPGFPLRAWRYGRRRLRDCWLAWRGYRILQRYSTHYRAAQRFYRVNHAQPDTPMGPSEIGVRVIGTPGAPDLQLPAHFGELVSTVAASAGRALDDGSNCDYFPVLAPGRTAEEAVSRGEVISIALREPLRLDGISALAAALVPQIEQRVYGSYVLVDKVYVYRSPISRQPPQRSWLWHFDNHPREILKMMVYLTDVVESTAPFEFIRDRARGRARLGFPVLPKYGDSRVAADRVARWLVTEAERVVITGKRGTVLLFDDNVVHRATLADGGHRDVVVFQLRPAAFKPSAPIDPGWTGSFPHHDYHLDPWALAPTLR